MHHETNKSIHSGTAVSRKVSFPSKQQVGFLMMPHVFCSHKRLGTMLAMMSFVDHFAVD